MRFSKKIYLHFSRIRHFFKSLDQPWERGLRRRSGFGITTLIPIPSHSRLIPQFHVGVRRERSPILPPKQALLSFSTYFSPSDKRSASQTRLLAYILEPEICRIMPNGAHPEVSRNACAGIGWICAGIDTVTPSLRGGLRRRSELSGVQVSQGPGPE